MSIYIPHVFADISKDMVREILEVRYKIGTIEKIECIPKVNEKDGHKYFSCFVFLQWSFQSSAMDLLTRLLNGEQPRIKYLGERYWTLCQNQSEVAFYQDPMHMDLVLYLHPDITKETVQVVMDGLDVGTVHSIDVVIGDTENKYTQPIIWENANKNVWNANVKSIYNTVYIRFEFWYRTKTSYIFQDCIFMDHFIDIPVFDGMAWTFYKEKPKFAGINPNVWKKNTPNLM